MSSSINTNFNNYKNLFIITTILVLFYFTNQYLINIKNKNNKNKNIIENFISPTPSNSLNDKGPSYYNNFFIETYLDIVYLKDKYSLEKIIIAENGVQKVNKNDILVKGNNYDNDDISLRVVKNTDWNKNFLVDNGIKCEGECGCMKNAFDINICGYKKGFKTYECPSVCSECNQCHQNENHIHLKYNSLCGKSKTLEDKEKCNMYKDRIVLSKKTCFHNKKNNKDNDNCEIFITKDKKNNFSVKDDIFLRISLEFPKYKFKIKDRIKNIELEKFLINEEELDYFIFYKDTEDLYLYFKPQTKDIGLSKLLYIEGKIFFKDERIETRDFKLKTVINIFDPKEKFSDFINEDNATYNFEENKNKNELNEVESYLFDNYSSNYLQDSTINRCPLVKNHSVINPLKNLREGEFVRKNLIDNPTTWKERIDINRPWISTL